MLCWFLISAVAVYFLFDWLIRLLKVDNFSNKYVLISGCDSGFGRELAIRLDKMGFPVFAGCLTPAGMESLGRDISTRLTAFSLDITIDESIQKALEIVKKALPNESDAVPISILYSPALWAVVNNAGVTGPLTFVEMCTRKDIEETIQVNTIGHMELTRVFLPLLRQSRGRVVTITSVMGRCPASSAPYCVSKYALEAYCDVLRREMSNFGVKVSIVEPGFFQTPLINNTERLKNNVLAYFNKASPEVKASYKQNFLDALLEMTEVAMSISSRDIGKVVDAYVAGITCTYPRPRYTVGSDAKFIFVPLGLMPEWILDGVLNNKRMISALQRSKSV